MEHRKLRRCLVPIERVQLCSQCPLRNGSRPAVRLRALRSFLLPVLFAISLAPPPAFAQSQSEAELEAMLSRS